jgi:hypothetical protein
MRIINWCSGGLGNRLKPLASCAVIAKKTNKKLGMLWLPTMRCQTHFSDLFKNEFEQFNNESFEHLTSAIIYTERPYISHDAGLNNIPGLLYMSHRYPVKPLSTTPEILTDASLNTIVYSNDYLAGYDKNECINFLKSLEPLDFLKDEIENFCKENSIDKNTIGVHARGTDFEAGGEQLRGYIDAMRNISGRFFVCSDSRDYENALQSEFGDRVIFRKKSSYVYKENPSAGWTNNVQTPKESVQESLIDLYVLSRTNFQIYNANSTFAHIAQDLS